ncbi:MAG: LacI family DNA-binding transcriptional regulator [Pseudomonadota bacterium]|nr:LacI family DNA-binding transcriptional regulator [Pseudomonadota bacterium]
MCSEKAAGHGRAVMADIAGRAGVSLATVDRVINRRKGVKQRTRQQVLDAALDLGFLGAEEMMRFSDRREANIVFLLPAGTNPYLRDLGGHLRQRVALREDGSPKVRCFFIEGFNAAALAEAIRRNADWADGIAFFAIDHPAVREAVAEVAAKGVRLVTVVSDLGHSGCDAYVGHENRSVGRTAGLLLGRFIAEREGAVALVAGSRHYRAHSEREAGFLSIQEEMFPHLRLVGLREGHDDSGQNYRHTIALLDQNPDLRGIYNVGGSSGGVARALAERGRSDVAFIGHGLTKDTRKALVEGVMDAVFHTDPDALIDRAIGAICQPDQQVLPMKLEFVFRENLP